MRPPYLPARLPLAAALALVPFAFAQNAHAQANAPTTGPTAAAPAAAAGGSLKTLNLDEYGAWNRIGGASISRSAARPSRATASG
jgi:hypothetical protein